MPERRIVQGQVVWDVKATRARELRRTMTPAEQVLWRRLRRNGLDGWHIRRQQVIDGLIVDFYCHAAGLVVEVDGSVHDDRAELDDARDAILGGRGLRTLRLRNEVVLTETDATLAHIIAACASSDVPR